MSRKWWVAVIALGVVLIPIGVVWMAYAITQADSTSTSTSVEVTDSWWPIAAFFVAFIGGTLVTVGMLGWIFSWFSCGDESDFHTSPSETLAQAVPTTRVGWGGDSPEDYDRREEARALRPGFATISFRSCGVGISRLR
jgi:hypothetical protein